MNSEIKNQISKFVIGCRNIPYIERVYLHGSCLNKEKPNDIDIVILFTKEFNFELESFNLQNNCPELLSLITDISCEPLPLDITYTSKEDVVRRAKVMPFYNHIMHNKLKLYSNR